MAVFTIVRMLGSLLSDYTPVYQQSTASKIFTGTFALLLFAILKYPDRAIFVQARPDLKGKAPRGYPLVGNMFEIIWNRENQLDSYLATHKCFGPVFTKTVPIMGRYIAVNTPQHLEHILKTNMENYVKGYLFSHHLRDILGHGIFVSDGAQWRFHRKTASNVFTTKFYRSLVNGAFKSGAMELCRVFDRNIARDAMVDLQSLFSRLTLDAFGKLTFGMDFQSLSKDGPNEFGDAFDFLAVEFDARVTNPFWFFTDRLIPGKVKRVQKALDILDSYAQQAITKRRCEALKTTEGPRTRDMLDFFINYRFDDGSVMDNEALRDVFKNFMIAGRDTTAQGLTWMFYHLMAYPHALENLRKEAEAVMGDSDEFEYETLTQRLPYAKAVFYETLRLYPPVPKNGKVALEDDILPDGTKVYKGDIIVFSNYCMARTTEVWGEDAEKFVPERWLVEDPTALSPFGRFRMENTFKFPSFNAGPRICLGQTFATIEALVTTIYVVRRYDFALAPNHPVPKPKGSVTIPMGCLPHDWCGLDTTDREGQISKGVVNSIQSSLKAGQLLSPGNEVLN
ncbi:hypothetical protein BGZ73_004873 [Actinomortierella ambigua]|nr:hypothetical protein BGZ73_004873 [Actinomortierella ambigua]